MKLKKNLYHAQGVLSSRLIILLILTDKVNTIHFGPKTQLKLKQPKSLPAI
uniref:Uncharacterized protein n=1 Tax=Manihot esculenta TaxID=3983 RepID=A0A2C9VHD7_MANES